MRGDQGEDTLLALYVALVVAALAGADKLMAVGPLAASATVIVYQLSFALIDYVNEIFSASTARTFVKHGFIAVSAGSSVSSALPWCRRPMVSPTVQHTRAFLA